MRFFEVLKPRHALLIAPTLEQAVKLYNEFSEEYIEPILNKVDEDYVVTLLSVTNLIGDVKDPFRDVREQVKNTVQSIVWIDN